MGRGKLAAIQDGDEVPVRYGDVYSFESTSGPDRLIVGPSSGHIEVLLSLASTWPDGYFLMYVLLVSRAGVREPGRYQAPGPMPFIELEGFCRRFEPFLEGDGRHDLWIGSAADAGLLVYDHHDCIWAYGDLSAYVDRLRARGFTEGEVKVPFPHAHHYHEESDASESALFDLWDWAHSPLQPDHDF